MTLGIQAYAYVLLFSIQNRTMRREKLKAFQLAKNSTFPEAEISLELMGVKVVLAASTNLDKKRVICRL